MPRAIASGMFGERNTGLCSDGMTEKKRGHGMGYPEMTKFMADCVIVCFFSIWFFLSICHSVSFGFYGGAPGAGEVLYIRGVDRLGEKNKHFYLSYRVPFHCE
jgi:hypothetical protein